MSLFFTAADMAMPLASLGICQLGRAIVLLAKEHLDD